MGGKIDIAMGRVKEAAGALIGNDNLREEGQADQVARSAKQAVQATVDEAKKTAQNVVDILRNQL